MWIRKLLTYHHGLNSSHDLNRTGRSEREKLNPYLKLFISQDRSKLFLMYILQFCVLVLTSKFDNVLREQDEIS